MLLLIEYLGVSTQMCIVIYWKSIFLESRQIVFIQFKCNWKGPKEFTKRLCYRRRLPNSDYISRLNFLNIDSLSFRRTVADLVIAHSIIVSTIDVNMEKFVVSQRSSSRGPNIKLRLSKYRSNSYLNSFNNKIVLRWNNLPCSISSIE